MSDIIKLRVAAKIDTKADIVSCVDATSSMQPCIDGIKEALHVFADGLQTAA